MYLELFKSNQKLFFLSSLFLVYCTPLVSDLQTVSLECKNTELTVQKCHKTLAFSTNKYTSPTETVAPKRYGCTKNAVSLSGTCTLLAVTSFAKAQSKNTIF